MQWLREKISAFSGPQLFLFYALVFGLVFWLLFALAGEGSNFVPPLAFALVMAAIRTPFTLLRRRRATPRGLSIEISEAIRTGNLPGLIDPNAWLAVLKRRRESLRSLPIVGAAVLVLALSNLALQIGSSRDGLTGAMVIAALGLALALWCFISPKERAARITALESKIMNLYGTQAGVGGAA